MKTPRTPKKPSKITRPTGAPFGQMGMVGPGKNVGNSPSAKKPGLKRRK